MAIPKWILAQVDVICDACISPFNGRMSGFDLRASAPKDNGWGIWLVAIAPEPLELLEQGPDDGAEIFDPMDVDLLALPRTFTEVESFDYDPGSDREEPHLLICGKVGKRDLVVEIFFQPFEDATARTVVDVKNKGVGWRLKRGAE